MTENNTTHRILCTGDIHGSHSIRKLSSKNFHYNDFDPPLTKDDYLIICGDFGLLWYPENSELDKQDQYWLNWLDDKPWTTLFVDGNHECVNKESDVLTENGWMNIVDAYNSNVKIANVDMETHKISFDYPLAKFKRHSDTIIDIFGINYKQSVTPNHDVIINGQKVKAENLLGREIYEEELRYQISSTNNGIDLSPIMIEVLTATVMDGTIVDYKKYSKNSNKVRVQFHLKKQRKIAYIKNILDKAGISYTVGYGKNDDTFIRVYGDDARMIYKLLDYKKELPRYFTQMNLEQFQYLIRALNETDGQIKHNNTLWRTTSLNDVNVIQELCIIHNYDMRVKVKNNASGYNPENCKTQYICSFGKDKNLHRKVSITEREYNDDVYCFTMPKGTLITRHEYCACVTGNCFPRLNSYPVEEWNGGKIHRIKDSVIHLMRGQVFTLGDKTFACIGGAPSHDIEYRIEGRSWWREEIPSQEERDEAIANLEKHNWKVDYVITHDTPTSCANRLIHTPDRHPNEYTDWLEKEIANKLEFNQWFFGHYHQDRELFDGKFQCMYHDITTI